MKARRGRRSRSTQRFKPPSPVHSSSADMEAEGHPRLHVHSDHPPGRPNQPGYFESEKAHAWAGLDYGHSGSDVGLEDLRWILPQLPNGTCNQIARPPGAGPGLSHFFLQVRRPLGTKIGSASSSKNAQGMFWVPTAGKRTSVSVALSQIRSCGEF
jgi:hypothetical protein